MRTIRFLINATGFGSWLTLLAYAVATSITFHPSVRHQVMVTIVSLLIVGLILSIVTLLLALRTVRWATPLQVSEARALRKRGLWLSLPQLVIVGVVLAGGLAVASAIGSR